MPELLELPVPGKWQTVLTDAALAQELSDKQTRRPAALHAFGSGAARRWHLSWVKNSGPDFEDWGWTAGDTPDALKIKVAEHSRVRSSSSRSPARTSSPRCGSSGRICPCPG
jgi:hypothetical protein